MYNKDFTKAYDDYILDNYKLTDYYKTLHQTREEVLKEVIEDYLYKIHNYQLEDLMELQKKVNNLNLKHFNAVDYVQDNKTCYFFKGELIFVIYFDNMRWISETYY